MAIILADIVLKGGAEWTGWTWGEESPTPHGVLPWSLWKVKESATDARDTGDYGKLQLIDGEQFVSDVKDMGGQGETRCLKISYDDYSSGGGSGTIQWRGSSIYFNPASDEVSGPTWEAYPAIGANKDWRYVQIKITG